MRLGSLGEFGLVARLTRPLPKRTRTVPLGVGDDCAVVRMSGRRDLLLTTDMLIEGVHFVWRRKSLRDIGKKALYANLADIAAMGGIPRYATVSIGLRKNLSVAEVEELYRGLREAAKAGGVLLVGGDTNRSSRVVLSLSLLGEIERGRALTRGGAEVGDQIYVTGALGRAAGIWRQGGVPLPPNRVPVGRHLACRGLATSCIDLSDGLLQDLGHILEASRVGATIELDRLPGTAPLQDKLAGGEDYELLFAVPHSVKLGAKIRGVPITRIGRISPLGEGLRLVARGGRIVRPPRRTGFSHF